MDFLLKFFPYPSYLRIPSVGVDISDRTVKYVELEKKSRGLCVKKFGKKIIERGAVEGGEIKNPDKLIETLSLLKKEVGNKYVVVSLPEEKAFVKTVTLPFMPVQKIKSALELQMEELVPFSPKEIVFDFEVISSSPGGETKVFLNVFPEKISASYAEVFEQAGLSPVVFELENQSVFRCLVPRGEQKTIMIIDFGKTRTSLSIGSGGTVKFGLTIPVAGEEIDKILAKEFKISIFEAEGLKKQQDIARGSNAKVINSIVSMLSVIKDEIAKFHDYWSGHFSDYGSGNGDISKIILCGGDSNLFGLPEYLSSTLNTQVELGNPWANSASFEDYIPEIEKKESLSYTTAIGLALRNFQND